MKIKSQPVEFIDFLNLQDTKRCITVLQIPQKCFESVKYTQKKPLLLGSLITH